MNLMVLCALALAGVSLAQTPTVSAVPRGTVNWATQTVRAEGTGAPDLNTRTQAQARLAAERAALTDAQRRLLEQVKALPLDGSRSVGELMAKDEVRARVEAVVRGYSIAKKRYFDDGGVVVELEVPLAMLNDVLDTDVTPVAAPGDTHGSRATGLIVDARGTAVSPALLLTLVREDGTRLYSIDTLSKEARAQVGVASWVSGLDEAKRSQRAGEKPLVIKAIKAAGVELTVSAEDVKRLSATNASFLTEGRVVVVRN